MDKKRFLAELLIMGITQEREILYTHIDTLHGQKLIGTPGFIFY